MTGKQQIPTDELISLAEAADYYGYNADYLRHLATRGRLVARKIGRNWVTTHADLEAFVTSRKKRGVFRKDIKV
jgi:hypothetical protein